jgi:hypothetical protein
MRTWRAAVATAAVTAFITAVLLIASANATVVTAVRVGGATSSSAATRPAAAAAAAAVAGLAGTANTTATPALDGHSALPTTPSTGHPVGGSTPRAPPVRFFIDEGFFLPGDTELLRAHISGSGGRMVVSGESSGAFLSVKGYYGALFALRYSCSTRCCLFKPSLCWLTFFVQRID